MSSQITNNTIIMNNHDNHSNTINHSINSYQPGAGQNSTPQDPNQFSNNGTKNDFVHNNLPNQTNTSQNNITTTALNHNTNNNPANNLLLTQNRSQTFSNTNFPVENSSLLVNTPHANPHLPLGVGSLAQISTGHGQATNLSGVSQVVGSSIVPIGGNNGNNGTNGGANHQVQLGISPSLSLGNNQNAITQIPLQQHPTQIYHNHSGGANNTQPSLQQQQQQQPSLGQMSNSNLNFFPQNGQNNPPNHTNQPSTITTPPNKNQNILLHTHQPNLLLFTQSTQQQQQQKQ